MKIKNIKRLEQTNFFDFQRVQPKLWEKQRKHFYQKYKINLPTKDYLKQIGDPKDLRILLSPITITINFVDTSWIQYKFERGFMTDLASVPKFFRNVIDNDDLDLLSAALVHDANFSVHFMPFKQTNRLFKNMIQSRGKKFKGCLAWVAVSSIIGRRRWKQLKAKRAYWTEQTVAFMDDKGNIKSS